MLVGLSDDGQIQASVMVGHDGHRGWLYYVASHPRVRGQGCGRAILRSGEDWLRGRGVKKVQLLVRESNTKVVAFYEHLGFNLTPRVVMSRWLR